MKIKFAFLIMIFLLSEISAQGSLVIIGGGKRPVYVMQKFIELAGGSDSKILVIPNASGDPINTGEYQVNQLIDLGAKNSFYIFSKLNEANLDSIVNKLDNVTGVFFSGGDQRKLTADLLNTRLLSRIKGIYNNGGVIAGTSAGAAVMSKLMITGDEAKNKDSSYSFVTIEKGNVITSEGFGFIDDAIIDQHFIFRKRQNRLISLVLENPSLLGIGIDEETSIIVNKEMQFEVLGEYQVLVYDASSSNISVNEKEQFRSDNIILHILDSNDKFDIINKRVIE